MELLGLFGLAALHTALLETVRRWLQQLPSTTLVRIVYAVVLVQEVISAATAIVSLLGIAAALIGGACEWIQEKRAKINQAVGVEG